MKYPIIPCVLILITAHALAADEKPSEALTAPQVPQAPKVVSWKRHVIDVEAGMIWNVGPNTPISYRIVTNQISWRTPYIMKKDFSNGSKVVFRNQFSLIANWVERGPEDYYFGLSGAPSFEWWSADDKWSVYFAVGGGFGVTNSADVVGGQGQDFTYNWFIKSGVRYQIDQDIGIYGGALFQHFSNRGATDPNPGIDGLGFTIGVSLSF